MNRLDKLFEPARIGRLELRNRIVMPPMATLYANPDGTVSDRIKAYHAARAKGGVGLIIVEITAVAPGGKGHVNQLSIERDEVIPGLRSLVDAVHHHGAKIAIQLNHVGRQTRTDAVGSQPVAPSPIPCPLMKEMPRELTTQEVEAMVEAYAEGARRAKEAGFDAVEFHGAHGYLICQFLSPQSNQRTDKYGGDLENRTSFALEIVEQAKRRVGEDFPILFRISADEYVPGGLTLEETRIIAPGLQQAGVHCLDVSAGAYGSFQMSVQPGSFERGCLVPLADEIKRVVQVPVITAGRINDPLLAEKIIEERKADLVAMGRALLADPELPNKAKEGRLDDVRMCTACYHCTDNLVGEGLPLSCSVNAALGREGEYCITPTQTKKKVFVAGGGPAGLEAARVAALRGHRVALYEEADKLGGQLLLAATPPHKQELSNLTRFLSGQITKLGVEVNLGQKVTPDLISAAKPEAVVVATGVETVVPDIPGVDRPNVVAATDIIAGKRDVGERVVIVGGGRVGCETAELLANRGKKVTIVRMTGRGRVAGEVGPFSRRFLLTRLRELGVAVEANTITEEITPTGVAVSTEGQRGFIDADTVVIAPAPRPNKELAEELQNKVSELRVIGDCAEPRRIADAIHEGFRAGLEI